tara:strand:+ start:5465 stop:5761 length:297 start_codon:yes stop_codon:yes gene_type:complete
MDKTIKDYMYSAMYNATRVAYQGSYEALVTGVGIEAFEKALIEKGLVLMPLEDVDEIERLRKVIARLGSNEAFDVATANVSKEEKMRRDFACAALVNQ